MRARGRQAAMTLGGSRAGEAVDAVARQALAPGYGLDVNPILHFLVTPKARVPRAAVHLCDRV